ncbi:hydrolases or acyltransferase [Punctularia strigosozonata HHB-11173 SS5]|uniref:hydrolases or acyltransferase n=1 Tax=Punctularia strigosozonata (strain HHB-11173) TaxID=741275 RepID=UPI00044174B3|nr:hydrolases or acyltransferase [Punctularia strigosozonata HHB-11173 SS5]EIN09256.1 hydrolases or acyltransferase [Punctularia strigosozonata HHB-11173 SS5]
MSSPKITEGEVNFDAPGAGKPCNTWYKVFGDLSSKTHRPLLVIHGGPGVVHQYLLPISQLAAEHGMPVIFYDQIGNGNSTHLPELKDDKSFWTEALFRAELDNLIVKLGIQDDFAILGHSWGGILAARLAADRAPGLKRLVLADCLTSMELWLRSLSELRAGLPQGLQDTLRKHEQDGTIDSVEYQAAVAAYYQLHVCRVDPMPEDLANTFAEVGKDPTVYVAMYGPTQFDVTGALKSYEMSEADMEKIEVPTLLINGKYDESKDYEIQKFFDLIPDVSWTRFAHSSHTPQLEEREKYLRVVGSFLTQS